MKVPTRTGAGAHELERARGPAAIRKARPRTYAASPNRCNAARQSPAYAMGGSRTGMVSRTQAHQRMRLAPMHLRTLCGEDCVAPHRRSAAKRRARARRRHLSADPGHHPMPQSISKHCCALARKAIILKPHPAPGRCADAARPAAAATAAARPTGDTVLPNPNSHDREADVR